MEESPCESISGDDDDDDPLGYDWLNDFGETEPTQGASARGSRPEGV
jgi:hypothetical protein